MNTEAEKFLPVKAEKRVIVAEVLVHQGMRELVMSSVDRRVSCEDCGLSDVPGRFIKRQSAAEMLFYLFEDGKNPGGPR